MIKNSQACETLYCVVQNDNKPHKAAKSNWLKYTKKLEGMPTMAIDPEVMLERVKSDPQFHELVRRRSRLAWFLSLLMVLIYFSFVLVIAFNKELFGKSLFGGITTVGIPVGLGVIVSAFLLTGIYVIRANSTFDDMIKQIIERVKK
jgi:uncharacterized membrane protein (DUF485 family)